MEQRLGLILLLLAGFSTASRSPREDKCYEVLEFPQLNKSEVFNGTWFEVARSNNNIEESNVCGTVIYSYSHPYGFISLNGAGRSVLDFTTPGNTTAVFNIDKHKSSYTVLDTDNTNYLVIYNCLSNTGDEPAQERVWVLSRTETPLPNVLETLEKKHPHLYSLVSDGVHCFNEVTTEDPEIEKNKCLELKNIAGPELNQVYEKTWFEIQRSKNALEDHEECGKVSYALNKNNLLVSIEFQSRDSVYGQGTADNNHAVVNFAQQPGSRYVVVDTDGQAFAIIYSCWQENAYLKQEQLWFLGENPSMSQDVVKLIMGNHTDLQYLLEDKPTCNPYTEPTTQPTSMPETSVNPQQPSTTPPRITDATSTPAGTDSTTLAEDTDSPITTIPVRIPGYNYNFYYVRRFQDLTITK